MSYLCYLCLLTCSGVQHILRFVFVLFFFVLCTLCCQFLWSKTHLCRLLLIEEILPVCIKFSVFFCSKHSFVFCIWDLNVFRTMCSITWCVVHLDIFLQSSGLIAPWHVTQKCDNSLDPTEKQQRYSNVNCCSIFSFMCSVLSDYPFAILKLYLHHPLFFQYSF
jgi:hypothetical protein